MAPKPKRGQRGDDGIASEHEPVAKKLRADGEAAEEQPSGDMEEDAPAAAAAAAAAAAGDGDGAPTAGQEEGVAAAEGEAAGAEDEGADAGAAEPAAADEEAAADEAAAAADEGAPAPVAPMKLGYRTFKNGREAADYLMEVIKHSSPHRPLNEYEAVLLLDLIQKGHPDPTKKLGKGVAHFYVAETHVGGQSSVCFHVKKLDGSQEDFSYRKCLQALFPDYEMKDPVHHGHHGGHRGRGGGRGGGGRGGGGRGGGRGGRGDGGGRGRGGRGRGRGGRR